ncbi:MAG TPA: MerR family transcriptional regulator [Clostridiales bacterium]|nr:MerR family transcriptional regulator [Clostridiales bacterium]HPZ06182.1 MerR family transcriptional regulator [Clostridiales bacterium]HQD31387.1 MerR family transcriptional regulator [Clostridiales bacterium]
MEKQLLRIGEIAAFFNVSVKAIRIYEKKSIIMPAWTDPATGYRYYSADQIQMLNALLELKALGFSLNEIKRIITGGVNDSELLTALVQKRKAWQDAISSAERKIDAIENIIRRVSDSRDAPRLQQLTDEERAWLLVKMVCIEDVRGQSILSEALWL